MDIKEHAEAIAKISGKDEAFSRELTNLIKNAVELKKLEEIRALTKTSEHFNDMYPDNLVFVPAYARALKKGDAVRTGISEYVWVKAVMISLQRASEKTNAYMRNFMRLSDAEKSRMAEIMGEFDTANTALQKVSKLASFKRRKKKGKGDAPRQEETQKTEEVNTESAPVPEDASPQEEAKAV